MAAFLDTNILIYSVSTVPEEALKSAAAKNLLDRTDCILSVQVLQEFYVQSTRRTRAGALESDMALALIARWRRFHVVENTLALFDTATMVMRSTNYSFWDSSIIAAAVAADCETLFTEDMRHGHRIDRLTILNPFAAQA